MKRISVVFAICVILIATVVLSLKLNSDTAPKTTNEVVQTTSNVDIIEQTSMTESSKEQYVFNNSEEWISDDVNSWPEYTSDMKELQPQNEEPIIISYEEQSYDNFLSENQWYYDKYSLYEDIILENGLVDVTPDIPYRVFSLENNECYILPPIISNGNTDDFEYMVHKNGKVQLIKYTGKSTNIIIPDEIEGKAVAYLGDKLFIDSNIKSIKFGKNVETVGSHLFYMCRQLNSVILSDKTEYIFDEAFFLTESLKQILLPNSLKYIGSDAFEESGIEKITIPTNVKVGIAAFSRTACLKELVLENGINNIEGAAFSECGVDYVYIPSSLTKIIDGAVFANCNNLKKVEFAETMDEETVICASMFRGCRNLTDIRFPSNITVICGDAFRGCSSLKKIFIPKSVRELGRGAFGECYNLTDIYFESPDCEGLEDSGIVGQSRTIYAPVGGNVEAFCNKHPMLTFIPVN